VPGIDTFWNTFNTDGWVKAYENFVVDLRSLNNISNKFNRGDIWLVFDGLNLKGKTSKKKEVLNNEFRNGYAGT
jgi:hypothetical protein